MRSVHGVGVGGLDGVPMMIIDHGQLGHFDTAFDGVDRKPCNITVMMTGDASLDVGRPMGRVITPLTDAGGCSLHRRTRRQVPAAHH